MCRFVPVSRYTWTFIVLVLVAGYLSVCRPITVRRWHEQTFSDTSGWSWCTLISSFESDRGSNTFHRDVLRFPLFIVPKLVKESFFWNFVFSSQVDHKSRDVSFSAVTVITWHHVIQLLHLSTTFKYKSTHSPSPPSWFIIYETIRKEEISYSGMFAGSLKERAARLSIRPANDMLT